MTRLIIADDQTMIRHAVKSIASTSADIEVIGEAADGDEAARLTSDLRPDVVLMDIRMPVLDGIQATQRICSDPQLSSVKVVVLTTFEEDENLFAALRAGASGFIGKGAEPDDIVRAITAAHAGEALLSPAATRSLIARWGSQAAVASAPARAELAVLTARELEMLVLIGSGLSNHEIAEQHVISVHTVKTHVKRIMYKLDARDRVQLVIIAHQHGLVGATRDPGGAAEGR